MRFCCIAVSAAQLGRGELGEALLHCRGRPGLSSETQGLTSLHILQVERERYPREAYIALREHNLLLPQACSSGSSALVSGLPSTWRIRRHVDEPPSSFTQTTRGPLNHVRPSVACRGTLLVHLMGRTCVAGVTSWDIPQRVLAWCGSGRSHGGRGALCGRGSR